MLVKKISFVRPNLLGEIEDVNDYKVYGFVELEDGYIYNVTLATAKNVEYLMDKEKKKFWQERYNLALSMEDFLNHKIDE